MKRQTLSALLIGAVLLTAAAVLFAAAWQDGEREAAVPTGYLLVDCGGIVAVRDLGSESLPELTAIRTAFLPAADRDRLSAGIPAADGAELAVLLEDLGC
ncbi:MAG: hypothetical protein IKQ10_05250 [Oscillospiraceae bacterium]|nr:hypothetical protein [Oscillospiraceae bacterium]